MNEERIKFILIVFGWIITLLFCLTPLVFMIIVSLSKAPDFLSQSIDFKLTLENYRAILSIPSLHFIDFMRNSIIVALISTVCGVFIVSLAAYAITRLELPGKIFILLFVLASSMLPQICLIGYLFKFMSNLGWINTYKALILPYIAWILPLSLWILTSYFSKIPKDLDKAALLDGCSRFQILHKIILPLVKPGLISCSLLAFIFAFNEFMFALMLTFDYKARTVPVGIALFQGLHGEIPWGNIMAASVVTIIPVVIITLIFQRHIIQGLTQGAVKG